MMTCIVLHGKKGEKNPHNDDKWAPDSQIPVTSDTSYFGIL